MTFTLYTVYTDLQLKYVAFAGNNMNVIQLYNNVLESYVASYVKFSLGFYGAVKCTLQSLL